MMFEEFIERGGISPEDPSFLLLLVSMFRDDFPALFELGMEVYRAVAAGKPEVAMTAVQRLEHLAEYMSHGPMSEEFGHGSKESLMILMEFPRMMHHMTRRLLENRPVRGAHPAGSRSK